MNHRHYLQLSSNDVPLTLSTAPTMNHQHCLRLGSNDAPLTLHTAPTMHHQYCLWLQPGHNDLPSNYWTQWTIGIGSNLAEVIYHQHPLCLWLQLNSNNVSLTSSLAQLQWCTIDIAYVSNNIPSTVSMAPTRLQWCTIGILNSAPTAGQNNLPLISSTAPTWIQQCTTNIVSGSTPMI